MIKIDPKITEAKQRVAELQSALLSAKGSQRRDLAFKVRDADLRLDELIHDNYFTFEPFEGDDVSKMTEEEINEELKSTSVLFRAVSESFNKDLNLDDEDKEKLYQRRQSISRYEAHLIEARENFRAERYIPGPKDAPFYEPSGCSATKGYVKSNPGNNDYYVEQYRDDPWYPAIAKAHEEISEIAPGYNISQIKEKFNKLRYYIELPRGSTSEQATLAYKAIVKAEEWVQEYELSSKR